MHNYLQFFNLQSDLNIYLRSYIKSKHVSFQNLNSWCETCNTTKICRRGVFFFFQLSSSFRSLLSMVQNYSSTLFFFFAISALYLSLRHVATVLEAPHPKNIFEVWLCSVANYEFVAIRKGGKEDLGECENWTKVWRDLGERGKYFSPIPLFAIWLPHIANSLCRCSNTFQNYIQMKNCNFSGNDWEVGKYNLQLCKLHCSPMDKGIQVWFFF